MPAKKPLMRDITHTAFVAVLFRAAPAGAKVCSSFSSRKRERERENIPSLDVVHVGERGKKSQGMRKGVESERGSNVTTRKKGILSGALFIRH